MRGPTVVTGAVVLLVFAALVAAYEAPAEPSGTPATHVDWGTYRPNLYFGTRTRMPGSLLTGLMWYDINDPRGFDNVRHDVNTGEIDRVEYTVHDGRHFCSQKMIDRANGMTLSTVFAEAEAGTKGGHWVARFEGTPLAGSEGAPPHNVSLIFYTYLESEGSLKVSDGVPNSKKKTLNRDVYIDGEAPGIGEFTIVIPKVPSNEHPEHPESDVPRTKRVKGLNDLSHAYYLGMKLPEDRVWDVREHVVPPLRNIAAKALSDSRADKLSAKGERSSKRKGSNYKSMGHAPGDPSQGMPMVTLPNTVQNNPNLVAVQFVVQLPFTLEVVFVSHDGVLSTLDDEDSRVSNAAIKGVVQSMTGAALADLTRERTAAFETTFDDRFGLEGKAGDVKRFAHAALSNLLGGLGYFYGSSLIRTPDGRAKESRKAGLFTGTPSRPFFPRGFLWDEGFHQMVVGEWDDHLSAEVIYSWLDQQASDGWIAREQILGREARSKVPEQFQVQDPSFANPPTMFFALRRLLERSLGQTLDREPWRGKDMDFQAMPFEETEGASWQYGRGEGRMGPSEAVSFLRRIFPKLFKWWRWYMRTQSGTLPHSFRWRGKTEDHTLTSGLDDFPRGPVPRDDERHVDLYCWMAVASRTMALLANTVGAPNEEYIEAYDQSIKHLDEYHWNENLGLYSDYGGRYSTREGEAPAPQYVGHVGYMNLFPLIAGLLDPASDRFGATLRFLLDEEHIMSPYGLRSMSKADPAFGTKENYWRGPIWININYLVYSALKRYYMESGPYSPMARQAHDMIRDRVVKNVHANFKRTGHFFEQYNPLNGKGQRQNPFNGWTSVVLLMLADKH